MRWNLKEAVSKSPVRRTEITYKAKGDGNPHVHLLVTMRPFNPDHSWGNKEVKDWDFVRDNDGNIVVDESHSDWWQDKKNPDRHGIRIPLLDENGNQKVGARNRKQWKRVLTDATGWNNPKNCEKTKCTVEKDADQFRKSVWCIITMEGAIK